MNAIWMTLLLAAAQKAPDHYNQWLGPNRDGHSADTGLLKEWPDGGPPLAYKVTGLGAGYSSVSFWKDRLYTMGDVDGACQLLALDPADGKVLWKAKVGADKGHGDYPGPRSTPATDGKLVVALGQHGDLVCVDAAKGKEKWRANLEKEFGGQMMSGWRWSESPLLDGKLVVVTPGGSKGTVLALDKESGKKVWQSGDLKDTAAYASLVPAEIGKIRQYLVLTDTSVAGISAKDGKLAWRADRHGETAVVPTPIYHDGFVFVTSGYNIGCNGFKISFAGNRFKAEEVYSGKQLENHHGGVIRVGDHVYGLDNGGTMKCVEIKTGTEVWKGRSVGKGSIAYADGHFVVRSEDSKRGTVGLVEATTEGYKEKGRFDQPDVSGRNTWAHPVVSGGKLFLRDQGLLLAYDVKAK